MRCEDDGNGDRARRYGADRGCFWPWWEFRFSRGVFLETGGHELGDTKSWAGGSKSENGRTGSTGAD
jgi:hypothetical protein